MNWGKPKKQKLKIRQTKDKAELSMLHTVEEIDYNKFMQEGHRRADSPTEN